MSELKSLDTLAREHLDFHSGGNGDEVMRRLAFVDQNKDIPMDVWIRTVYSGFDALELKEGLKKIGATKIRRNTESLLQLGRTAFEIRGDLPDRDIPHCIIDLSLGRRHTVNPPFGSFTHKGKVYSREMRDEGTFEERLEYRDAFRAEFSDWFVKEIRRLNRLNQAFDPRRGVICSQFYCPTCKRRFEKLPSTTDLPPHLPESDVPETDLLTSTTTKEEEEEAKASTPDEPLPPIPKLPPPPEHPKPRQRRVTTKTHGDIHDDGIELLDFVHSKAE
jgi:hypothetical protein